MLRNLIYESIYGMVIARSSAEIFNNDLNKLTLITVTNYSDTD